MDHERRGRVGRSIDELDCWLVEEFAEDEMEVSELDIFRGFKAPRPRFRSWDGSYGEITAWSSRKWIWLYKLTSDCSEFGNILDC